MASELGVQTIQHTNGTDALTIDSSGRVSMPQLPCASVGLTSSNPDDTTNPYTNVGVIKFDDIFINQGNVYSASTGRFTAPVTGIYEISLCLLQDDDGTIGHLDVRLRKNGTDINEGSNPYSSNDTKYHQVSYTKLIDLSANDYLEVKLHTGGIFISTSNSYYNVVNFRLVG